VLVFTDADTTFAPETLRELASNFADPHVGGVAANEVVVSHDGDGGIVRGEGLYWRYDQWIKRLEDRVGSTVSASGRLYAIRRELFRPPLRDDGADDFLISTEVVRAGRRLAFDECADVFNEVVDDGGSELRRKIRVMNQGHRAAMSLGPLANPFRGGLYAVQLLSHQVLRRFVVFFLLALLTASAVLAAGNAVWWLLLAPQLAFYALALLGWVAQRTGRPRARVLWLPYFFCLANLAAGAAMLSLAAGVRYRRWTPVR
jgi:cellulose synthase/poly-beta-1,6-N-acetylglucosamine synthase-like glycosyltransferase